MAGKIPQAFIHDLIARVDLVDLIDARVPLKKSGTSYTARCPFHSEKTPSFSVSREKQFYHCFGCGAHGNAISFLMEYERLSFPEAVESLAETVGLAIPREPQSTADEAHSQDLRTLYDIQERAARFYARQFKVHPEGPRAAQYLINRGITGDIAKRYLIGFAPSGWRNLPLELPVSDLETCGLMVKTQDSQYDRFRNRIMFPIRDRRGRVIGFGGRVMGDEKPKYLNSPETPVFTKHREVYGLYELLTAVRKPSRILVVEGYLDVISLAQHGIPYAVATLGTATSDDHVALLLRYTDELVFCFDGDAAGTAAAWKALNAALPSLRDGKKASFLSLPEGQDPDSLVQTEGKARFEQRVDEAIVFSDYFFQRLTADGSLGSLEGKAALLNQTRPLLERMPAGTLRDMMTARLEALTGVRPAEPKKSTRLNRNSSTKSASNQRPSPVRTILALLIQHPRLIRFMDEDVRSDLLNNPQIASLARQLFDLADNRSDLTPGNILEAFRGTADEQRVESLGAWAGMIPDDGSEAEFRDALERFRQTVRHRRLTQLLDQARIGHLAPAEREELSKLLKEKSA